MVMPKKPEEEKRKQVTVTLDPRLLERIDRLGSACRLTRTNTIENLLSIAVPLVESIETFRFLTLGAIVRDGLEKFRTNFRKTVNEVEEEMRDKES